MPPRDQAAGSPQYIGRYRLVDRIGRGGMGMVYAAEDKAMGRQVAVKIMTADLEHDQDTRERFYREARVTGQLLHRNIVTVFDLGDDRGYPYIVMELLDGLPLGAFLTTPAATLTAKLELMVQACEGLQVAHHRGVVHRDIKPSNLFVQRDGTLKILDFGVARLAASTLTASGLLVGTPDYMSPEQARGEQVDARSDVFSAAGVFYFMLSGRAPFAAADLPRVLHGVMFEDPRPLNEVEAPDRLRSLLTKALAKDPEHRYQTCADMRDELEAIRRIHETESIRIAQAAQDRYRQLVGLVQERRTLGRTLALPDIDAVCDSAMANLAARYPSFAKQSGSSLAEPLERSVASSLLASLRREHNEEMAAVEALRARVVPSSRVSANESPDLTLRRPVTNETTLDLTLIRTPDTAAAAGRPPFLARVTALWRRLATRPRP